MRKRVSVQYRGQVQGVGFRYTARSVANRHDVSGWVRNLPDGGVELVAEGEERELRSLLSELREQMAHVSFKESDDWLDAQGLQGFEIRF